MTTLTIIKDAPKDANAVPLVLVHDGGGTIFNYFILGSLHRHLYAIPYPHWDSGEDFEGGLSSLAQYYCTLIREKVPKGRILLGGWSLGALISLEMCYQLVSDTDYQIAGLVMVDSPNPKVTHGLTGIPTRELSSVAANTRPSIRDKILRSMEISGNLIREWTLPQWTDDASCPPAVLLRAEEFVPIPEDHQARAVVDLARENERLGWEEYDALRFKHVINVSGRHHFNIFNLDTIDETTEHIVDACNALCGQGA